MSRAISNTVLRDLNSLYSFGAVGGLGDAELIERFLDGRDEEVRDAFAALVERHGPMVLGVCFRVLRDVNDAEDAFQVTFMALVRKARTIAGRDKLANWLYGVALRSSRELRTKNATRRVREAGLRESAGGQAGPSEYVDTLEILDEELGRLPDKFRAPVVLCDLEGKTHQEASRILNLPVGTVSSRLVRARDRLRERLIRRGLAPSAVGSLGHGATARAVPADLVVRTSSAATRHATGVAAASAVPQPLASLVEGVLRTMWIARLTTRQIPALLALLLAGALGAVGMEMSLRTASPRAERGLRADEAGDRSWVGRLTNADEATRRRLLRCVSSVERNFAAARKLTFGFDLTRRVPTTGAAGRVTLQTLTYKGKVYWKDGSVRYDFDGDSPMILPDDKGRPLPRNKGTYSVIRTGEMAAAIEDTPFWGTVFNVDPPPSSREAWTQKPSHLTILDPWVHYAASLRPGRSQLADMFQAGKVIESREDAEGVHFRLVRDNGSWVEIVCDPASDDLPVQTRAGGVQGGKPVAHVGADDVWKKTDGVWYPARHVEHRYGEDGTPYKSCDLIIHDLRVNDVAEVPDLIFTVDDMPLPEGIGGSDNRKSPPTELVKANGIVRRRRPTERPIRRSDRTAPAPRATSGRGAKEEYLALVAEYEAALKASNASAMTEGGNDLRARLQPIARVEAEYADRFLAFAAGHPGEVVALDALTGVLVNRFTPRESERAAEVLACDWIRSESLVPSFRQLGEPPLALSAGGMKLLRAGIDGAAPREARGRACLGLALLLKNRAEAIRELQGPGPDPLLRYTAEANGLDLCDVSAMGSPEALEREAAGLFDRVVEQYAEIPGGRGLLGGLARDELFRLRELAVGKVAPEVEGADVDGRTFKLSDYRGKVVVLTFSGNWCGPCRAMYPRERDLVARMKGRRFALLSVNTDSDKGTLRDSIKAGEITWPCWWEGGDDRPNCARFRVEAFPTVYVLDASGVIRARGVRGEALDRAVERWIQEADAEGDE